MSLSRTAVGTAYFYTVTRLRRHRVLPPREYCGGLGMEYMLKGMAFITDKFKLAHGIVSWSI
jgi:hypothetical protein